MLLLFLCLARANLKICICNNDSHVDCPSNIFNASSKDDFYQYLFSHASNEKDVELFIYSKQSGFSFSIDQTKLQLFKISIQALSKSQPIQLKIKHAKKCQTINMNPNDKMVLPNQIQKSKMKIMDKKFDNILPFNDALFHSDSSIKQISGCEFSNINENVDYIITLEKEVTFVDNFFYESNNDEHPSPLRIKYNGFIKLSNCTFQNANGRKRNKANLFYCDENYAVSAAFDSCQFINCGYGNDDQALITIENGYSNINVTNCTFISDTKNASRPFDITITNAKLNNCSFKNTGGIYIKQFQHQRQIQSDELPVLDISDNTIDSNPGPASNGALALFVQVLGPSEIIFCRNEIFNIQGPNNDTCLVRIDLNDFIDNLNIDEVVFINNTCYSLYGGGSGFQIRKAKNITFNNCTFINNSARKCTSKPRSSSLTLVNSTEDYYNGDGGGIQIGFECTMNEVSVAFLNCVFKDNKAERHGGAIAIQTLKQVDIIDCDFESNKANYNFDSSSNLLEYDTHYHKKLEGRGGAIYINPAYSYKVNDGYCYDKNLFMDPVTINNCNFTLNSARDGFAIYIEGDDPGTNFIIESNNFTNNYNFGSDEETDPNITKRGVIATEIHSIQENIVKTNLFNDVRYRNLVYVDHYGNRITKEFTESKEFTYSDKFSESKDFTYSNKFSGSKDFTYTNKFSESKDFTYTNKFSESKDFSFSEKFTESKYFTKSDYFPSGKFSLSNYFSNSEQFSESQAFSSSVTLPPNETICSIFVDNELINLTDCKYSVDDEKHVYVLIIADKFEDIKHDEGNGAAINLINCGVSCNNTEFIDCVTNSGAGGAIFINNSLEIENNATFIDALFLRCQASYGGAVFIFAQSYLFNISFSGCTFESNSALLSKPPSNQNRLLFGGSALFVMSYGIDIQNSSFRSNKASSSSVKIINIKKENSKSVQSSDDEKPFSFIDCKFEQHEASKSSIYYADNKNANNRIELFNCEFKGKLKNDSNYIKGMLNNKERLNVKSCIFEDDVKKAINLDLVNDELKVDFILNDDSSSISNKNFLFVFGFAIALIIVIALKTIRAKDEMNDLPFVEELINNGLQDNQNSLI